MSRFNIAFLGMGQARLLDRKVGFHFVLYLRLSKISYL
jgi:hypothetical protein